jgi:L-ascorbate metabolism protein UlaG (beta-lactamase superfamily)
VDIRFLGHACFELSEGDTRILIDPFLTGNPKAAATADEMNPTHIFLTHGHSDHYGDVVDIAKRTNAQCVATVEFDGGWVRLTPAWHTSTTPNGTVNTPAGLVINLGGKTVYHLGDTSLFSDLALPKQRDEIDVALMCIGGHYTMDPVDGVAAAELVGAKQVIPCHYNTFPPIEQDAEKFKNDVKSSEVVVLEPGETHSI